MMPEISTGEEETASDKGDKGMELAWSVKGAWSGVAGDEREGVIYVLARGGKCVELDAAGKTRREFNLPGASGNVLRLADWPGEEGRALLTFGVWASDLQAYDLQGKALWTYPRSSGIDDVWATRVQGGKAGGVIVGFNGGPVCTSTTARGRFSGKRQPLATSGTSVPATCRVRGRRKS
ncbi:MAG: hypothetical protein HY290_04240 [Planctomycetia bacterium]|nr:hypothetical protein [Planctomycetia bacterium]